ncbi:ABC transporter substrate-binding protein [Pelagovum pacificum]|uniref:ABC transporter substrate-binding protein n=1 Tax=Pelagovum pacificum TaxID=2588711 RepID=A0A5C5GCL5_9RHOB|nr:ABC transporter substrate-binding protein [Pelagovum pacificum]QQA44329.1 ABC transporter substrate-binding protein [Pelagovum pacificum]TNY32552.1 ABC transporter substrate-binding protein [Pelagovum pacificum]
MKSLVLSLPVALIAMGALAQETTVETCYGQQTFDAAPTRAVTLNQQATEVMLALGLEGSMVGTAYMDDEIPAQWAEAYESVPVLAEQYPAREIVLAEEPDFLFAGFGSAFNEDNLGAAEDWHELGIGTYLANASCSDLHPEGEPLTTQPIFTDIEIIGDIFGIEDRAAEVAAEIRARFDAVSDAAPGAGMTAFLFDSGDTAPYTAGCCGSAATLMRQVGLESITADVQGRWAEVSWELVVAADPDVIVLNDADWSTADEKRAYMENDPVLGELRAVQAGRFVTVPFSQTVLGMQFVDGVENLSDQLGALE